jgi:hypothetical protein
MLHFVILEVSMRLRNSGTCIQLALALALLQSAAVAAAQSAPASGQSSQASIDKSPTVKDVAATPLTDLNMKKRQIPPVLERAVEAPYTLAGLASCGRIVGAVKEINAALGEDIDEAHARHHAVTAGRVAQSVVDSFIPFGGIIKEVSGANAEQRRMQSAIAAGFARRGFLKGVGLARHCPAPARPA